LPRYAEPYGQGDLYALGGGEAGWSEQWDDSAQATYWFNAQTGEVGVIPSRLFFAGLAVGNTRPNGSAQL
jgi:hypothetical protein